jgi:molecular chaperone GrpE
MSLNFLQSEAERSEAEHREAAPAGAPPLPLEYWVRLTNQLDRLQATLDDVLTTSEAGRDQTVALLRHLTDPARERALDERLADLIAGQEAGQAEWQAFADKLAGGLNDLAQAMAKSNRTQFKSNTLAEMKDQQVTTALGALQEIAARREQAQEARAAHEQERAAALRAEARGEFAADFLPALDGLEMALESGRALLDRRRAAAATAAAEAARPIEPPSAPRPTFWQRLAWALWGRGLPPGVAAPSAPAPAPRDEIIGALEAWLRGLEMVRTRFLGLLAAAAVYPIQAEGQPFDPRLHLALTIESRAGTPDGIVVAVLRKGYQQRGRVLRYAEVAVNRVAEATPAAPPDDMVELSQPELREDHVQQNVISESEEQ